MAGPSEVLERGSAFQNSTPSPFDAGAEEVSP